MKRSLAMSLCFATLVVAASVDLPTSVAAEPEEVSATLEERVAALETQVHELRQLVNVLRREQLRDTLPIQPSAIVGTWVAKADEQQTITLSLRSDGTCEMTVVGGIFCKVHGTGTWSIEGPTITASYQYAGQDDLPQTTLPLELISRDAMAFAGVIYRRMPETDANAISGAE